MSGEGPAGHASVQLGRFLVPVSLLPILLLASFLPPGHGEDEAGGTGAAKGDLSDPFAGRNVLTFEPREARAASLPRGPASIVQLLHNLAATGGKIVCWEDADPGARVSLPRAVEALDLAAATEILAAEGYRIQSRNVKGKEIYWVDRAVPAPRKQGRIVRPGDKGPGEGPAGEPGATAAPGEPRSPRPAAGAGGLGKVRLFAEEGEKGPRYMVVFETDSRKEADEAAHLLKAYQRSREAPAAPRQAER